MSTDRPQGSLYTRIEDRVAHVEFGHPAGNSFVLELLERLTQALDALSEDDGVSVIVLRSEGDGAFCAGASLSELVAVSTVSEGTRFFSGFAHAINAMRKCRKPIVGRVHGKVVGGGVGLVAACDYVLASEAAAIRLSELSIGIGPFVIAPALERKMGVAALGHLSLAPNEWKNAYWAQEKGLYDKVFEKTSELDTELGHYLAQLSACPMEALAEWKKTLWAGTAHWEQLLLENAALSARLGRSEFTQHALSKFKK